MKYYSFDNYYFALDRQNQQSYMCRITPIGEHLAQTCTGGAAAHQIKWVESHESKAEITEDEFQAKFSEAVEKLHNETPFA